MVIACPIQKSLVTGFTNNLIASCGGFTPSSLSGLYRWYDASDSSTISHTANKVTQWDDKSGNDYHATQTTDANRPVTGSATQNGLNGVAFTASSSHYLATNATILFNGNTTFMVFKATNGNLMFPAGGYYALGKFSSVLMGLYRTASSPDYAAIGSGTDTASSLSGGSPVNETRIIYGYSNNGGDVQVFSNTSAGPIVTDTFTTTTEKLSLGGATFIGTPPVATSFANGELYEVVEYDRVLTADERNKVRDYLNDKWGVY